MTRGRWIVAGIGCAVVAGMLVVVGVDVTHAVLGGLALLVLTLLVTHLGLGQHVALPRLPYGRRDGVRTEISSLSWALHGDDGISPVGQRQLRRVALTSLYEAGIDPTEPEGRRRAVGLLGEPMVGFLLSEGGRVPDARAARATVTTLEKLEGTR